MAKQSRLFSFLFALLVPLLFALGCSGTQNPTPDTMVAQPPTLTRTPIGTPSPTNTVIETIDPSICLIVTPTPSSETWFSKMCVANGLEILGSIYVNDLALEQAHKVVIWVFNSRPDLLQTLVNENVRLVIYNDDVTPGEATSIPNLAAVIETPNKGVYDPVAKLIVTWDDDLICNLEDRDTQEGWSQYTIHEIAHAVYHIEIYSTPEIAKTLEYRETVASAYDASLQDWLGEGVSEYWAESVTAYFGVYYNPNWRPDSTVISQIGQGDLQLYEPEIHDLIAQIFGKVQGSQPGCPE